MINIDFLSTQSHFFLNPNLNNDEIKELESLYNKYKTNSQIWLASSGSSKKENESLKLIALSKKAILTAAVEVNNFFDVEPKDQWLKVLPNFHVAGIAISARASLLNNKVIEPFQNEKWNTQRFYKILNEEKSTLISLVPTQVYDLVTNRLKAPSFVKAILVGGSALNQDLYEKAKGLGWPIYASYGLTECSSAIAIQDQKVLNKYKILPHVELSLDKGGILKIKSKALLDGFAQVVEGKDQWRPRQEDMFQTSDLAEIENDYLKILGRESFFVKVNAEGVNLQSLQNKFDQLFGEDSQRLIYFVPDERSGNRIVLVHTYTSKNKIEELKQSIKTFNAKMKSIEKISELIDVKEIPKNDMGKLNELKLKNYLALSLTNKVK